MLIIPLTRGFIAKIDDEDFDRVMTRSWSAEIRPNTVYAAASLYPEKGSPRIRLHRFILGLEHCSFPHVDHRDGDGLNCQKHNLRTATVRQNAYNYQRPVGVSGFRGVSLKGGRYYAKIRMPDGVRRCVGGFATAEEAARRYDEVAKQYHGDFATLNFPTESEEP